jgi:hypothetical protein
MVGTRTPSLGRRCGGQPLEQGDARQPERLGVGADVDLADLDEVLGIEEPADRDLLLDRPASRLARLARQHPLLEIVQTQGSPP